MTSLNKKLSAIALILVVFCIVSFLPIVSKKSAPKPFQSAFLNPSHKDEVTEIVLTFQQKENERNSYGETLEEQFISLKKMDVGSGAGKTLWIADDGLTTVRADEKLIENLLINLTKIRKMYTISDSKGNQGPYICAATIRNDDKMYAKIDFFATNSLTNRIMLGVENKKSLYETDDTVSQFFQTNVSFWSNPGLVQMADAPISFIFQENGKNFAKIDEFSSEFAKKSHEVMVLRHGMILPPQVNERFAGEPRQSDAIDPSARLTVADKNGFSEVISFYARGDGSYRCEYRFFGENRTVRQADEVHAADTLRFTDDLRFAFEISGWTYDRLRSIFQ